MRFKAKCSHCNEEVVGANVEEVREQLHSHLRSTHDLSKIQIMFTVRLAKVEQV